MADGKGRLDCALIRLDYDANPQLPSKHFRLLGDCDVFRVARLPCSSARYGKCCFGKECVFMTTLHNTSFFSYFIYKFDPDEYNYKD